MKRKILIVLSVVMVVFLLTACGKFTCDACGQEKTGKQHKEEFLGLDIVICDDCYKSLNAVSDYFGDSVDDLKDSVKDSLDDLEDYIDENRDDVEDALGDSLDDLEDYVEENWDDVGDKLEEGLGKLSDYFK